MASSVNFRLKMNFKSAPKNQTKSKKAVSAQAAYSIAPVYPTKQLKYALSQRLNSGATSSYHLCRPSSHCLAAQTRLGQNYLGALLWVDFVFGPYF